MGKRISEQTKDELKARLLDYIQLKHRPEARPGRPFLCLNPAHNDKKPSMSIKDTFAKCFSCGASYDTIELIQRDTGMTFPEAVKYGCEMFSIWYIEEDTPMTQNPTEAPGATEAPRKPIAPATPTKDYSADIAEAQSNIERGVRYIEGRGISIETARRSGIGYMGKYGSIIAPQNQGGYSYRSTNGDSRGNAAGVPAGLCIFEAAEAPEYVIICEGFFDALSVIEVGGAAAIALNSTSNAKQFTEYYTGLKQEKRPKVFICLDNDNSGKAAADLIKKEIPEAAIFPLPAEVKDLNQLLQQDREKLQKLVQEAPHAEQEAAREEYNKRHSATAHYMKLLNAIDDPTPHIPTGFKLIDNILGGGLRPGLYVIGALSSMGKTTFTLQMSEQIAEAGTDVLFFSLEMAAGEIVAKGISRRTYDGNTGLNTVEIIAPLKGERKRIIAAGEKYQRETKTLFIQEMDGDGLGIEAMCEAIQQHKQAQRKTPVIVVDYLQIIPPEPGSTGDKRAHIDRVTSELKRISRRYNTPVIVISSLNRNSYNGPVSFDSFKESGGIEYSCDTLIALEPARVQKEKEGEDAHKKNTEETRRKRRRVMEVNILKQRNGRTGGGIFYLYATPFNSFDEMREGITAGEAIAEADKGNSIDF